MSITIPCSRNCSASCSHAINERPGAGGGPPLGTYRYWRIANIVTGGSEGIELSELQLLTGVASPIGAPTWTASAAPTPGAPTGFDQLNDGLYNAGTYWSQAAINAGLQIDMDAGVPVGVSHFKQGGFDNSARYIVDADIFASSDGVSYTQVGDFEGLVYPGNNTLSGAVEIRVYTPPVAVTATYRYWEFRDITRGGSALLEISELEVVRDSTRKIPTAESSTYAPTLSLGALTDNALNTRCYWSPQPADLVIQLDLGSSQECDGWRQAGYDDNTRYIAGCTLYGSDNGSDWTLVDTFSGLTYPGHNTRSEVYSFT